MHSSKFVLALLFCVLCLSRATLFSDRVISPEGHPKQSPSGWVKVRPSSEETPLTVTIALRHSPSQRNALEKIFWAVTDPDHELYGQYLSNDEITKFVSPSPAVVVRFTRWFAESSIDESNISWSANRDIVTIKGTVSSIERLTRASFHEFYHSETGKTTHRSVSAYSVPAELREYVAFVSSMHRFPRVPKVSQFGKFSGGSSAPVSAFIQPGSEHLGLFVGIKCLDGSFSPCAGSGSSFIVEFQLTLSSGSSLSSNDPSCKPCSAWTSVFQEKCSGVSGASSSTIFCNGDFKNLPNYSPITPLVTTYFGSSSSSPLSFRYPVILSDWVTPQSLKDWYNIPQGLQNHPGNSQSVAEFLEQYYSPKDLSSFFGYMGLQDESSRVIVKGPNNVAQPGGEASLDIQYIMGVSSNIDTTFWSVAGRNPDQQEPFLVWLTEIQNDPKPPLVHSVSYDDQEDMLSVAYMDRVNAEFIKAGARGLSLLFAAGDDGAAGYLCRTEPKECETLSPAWPSSSPYVTAIGGTQFSKDVYPWCNYPGMVCSKVGEVTSSSSTGSRITTGGGFSNLFAQPGYQTQAVKGYLGKTGVPASAFNSTAFSASIFIVGRAYPDISGLAHNYLVYLAGELIPVDGTSASTPLVAAMIALTNDMRLQSRLYVLSFADRAHLADLHSVYNDIVMGNNACSANPDNCAPFGFDAAPGYDAVTGLGSIDFSQFMPAAFAYGPEKSQR